jgi:hypothetical protein
VSLLLLMLLFIITGQVRLPFMSFMFIVEHFPLPVMVIAERMPPPVMPLHCLSIYQIFANNLV